MDIREFRKRLLITLAVVAAVAVILFLFPIVTSNITRRLMDFMHSYFIDYKGEYDKEKAQPYIDLYFTTLRCIRIALGMVIVVMIVRLVNFLIFKRASKEGQHETPALIRNMFSIAIYIIALFTIVKSYFPDADLTSIFTTSTILGIILGLALQDTLGNLLAAIATQAEEPFKVGDVIKMGTQG